MTAGPPGPGPVVFVDDLEQLVLDDADRHHLQRVLRLRDGDPLVASDGAGRWRACRFGAALQPTAPIVEVAPPARALTVAFALPKGDRPELIVQKLTELGIDRIVPMVTERSVVQWSGDKAARAVERLRAVARGAAAQSRRCRLPFVSGLVSFATAAGWEGAVRAEPDGRAPATTDTVLLIGPEGGWAPGELAAPIDGVGLGDGVLRVETAAIAGASLLAALRAGLVAPRDGSDIRA